MSSILLVALALLSTAGRNDCLTPCGMFALGIKEDCDAMAKAEAVAIVAYRTVAPMEVTCRALSGYVLTIHSDSRDGYFMHKGDPYTRGLQFSKTKQIVLADFPIVSGAYVHEVGHALDHHLGTAVDGKHVLWQERGFCSAAGRFWVYFGVKRRDSRVCS